MCGIAGCYHPIQGQGPTAALIQQMLAMIEHRGPDEFGLYLDAHCGLGHARLSIIDLATGSQPLCNEDETLWITFNGEIFNYLELRELLQKRGHQFRTQSDTEVIVHAFEEWGKECLSHFNGQFAFAIWNSNTGDLFFARDRLGICPLYYTEHEGSIAFASEIKALFCLPGIPRELDRRTLSNIFTWWTPGPGETAFRGIHSLPAGHCALVNRKGVVIERYWTMEFPEKFDTARTDDSWAEELRELLADSVRLRLRADVPVGAYLSGGLDSSATTSLAKQCLKGNVSTFSINFEDEAYDEGAHQAEMSRYLGTDHRSIRCSYQDIASNFPRVIWHGECPVIRTAPTPLYLLSKAVRESNMKVILTGEGADEIFVGYDLFKETAIRHFWARQPQSESRARLIERLYPTLPLSPTRGKAFLKTFYSQGLLDTGNYHYSHDSRIRTTQQIQQLFSSDVKEQLAGYDPCKAFVSALPANFSALHPIAKAQFLEVQSLLSGYLLSSQGDRVSAANAIEVRPPFLDHRLVEFAAQIPPHLKMRGLKEKYILKRALRGDLPASITSRVKQPYMAPDANSFVQSDSPNYVKECFSEQAIKECGVFDPAACQRLFLKCERRSAEGLTFKDNMAFVAVLSTQLLHAMYVSDFVPREPVPRARFNRWIVHQRV